MIDLNLDGLTDLQLRLFAVRRARRLEHLMDDPRSVAALDVAERHARGEATNDELQEACDAAEAAAWEADEHASWKNPPDELRAAWAAHYAAVSNTKCAALWAAEAAEAADA